MNRRNCFTTFHLLNINSDDTTNEKSKGIEKIPEHSIRFDERSHFPMITATSVRCKNEKCKKTTYVYCQKCKAHLCLVKGRNCSMEFHTLSMDQQTA